MDIKQLQYFVVSVDMGSFHAAAEVLITTQPNVSKIVKSLEDELQMPLLQRHRNGVTITTQGEIIYRYAIEILQNMKTIRELKDGMGVERLSISSVPSDRLAAVMAGFYNEYIPHDFQMEFWEGNVEDLITRIHKKNSELGFVYLSSKNISAFNHHVKMKGLVFVELEKLPLYLYAGKNNPLSKFTSISEQMLSKVKLVQYYEKQYSLYSHLGHLKEDIIYSGESADIAYTNSDHFVIQLLKRTEYCSISSSFTRNKFDEYGIVAIPIEPFKSTISFGYIKRSKDHLSKPAKKFLDYLTTTYITSKTDIDEDTVK